MPSVTQVPRYRSKFRTIEILPVSWKWSSAFQINAARTKAHSVQPSQLSVGKSNGTSGGLGVAQLPVGVTLVAQLPVGVTLVAQLPVGVTLVAQLPEWATKVAPTIDTC